MRTSIVILVSMVILSLTHVACATDTNMYVKLQWEFPTKNVDGSDLTDIAGVKLFYGTVSSNYTETISIGVTNAHTVTGLEFGRRYYFNGIVFNSDGVESDYTTEVSALVTKPNMLLRLIVGDKGVKKIEVE